jgi:sialic acid synthase SpsE
MKIIAEIGSNYVVRGEPSLNRALALVDEAAAYGATHAKFQMFTGETLHSNQSMVEKLNKVALPREWIPELVNACKTNGIEFLCTPFSPDAVEFLDDWVNEWKIASWDITYIPLLIAVAQTGKPVILSTAGASNEEILAALALLRADNDLHDVTVLHCHAGYPVGVHDVAMKRMLDIAVLAESVNSSRKPISYGLSSHYPDPLVNATTAILGGNTIEFHFDLIDMEGAEARHSLHPMQLNQMVQYVSLFKDIMTRTPKNEAMVRQSLRQYRRSDEDWLRPASR